MVDSGDVIRHWAGTISHKKADTHETKAEIDASKLVEHQSQQVKRTSFDGDTKYVQKVAEIQKFASTPFKESLIQSLY
jgi:flagellar basal body rod protein FlgF